MAAINHGVSSRTTAATTNSTSYVDVDTTNAAIASSNFTAGKKYLLFVTYHKSSSSTGSSTGLVSAQFLHGTTAFAESEDIGGQGTASQYFACAFMTVWTAGSGEGHKMQFKAASVPTTTVDQITMFWMNLSDDVTENTDWAYGESATDFSLTTVLQSGGSVTIVPNTSGHDWLVASYDQIDATSATVLARGIINRAGEGASSLPQWQRPYRGTGYQCTDLLVRVFNLGNASNTFEGEHASITSSAHTRLHSSIFILDLNKFAAHGNAYTEADTALGTGSFGTQLQTASITPTVTSDVWAGVYWGFDIGNTSRLAHFRMQLDNADSPATQTSDNYPFHATADATAEIVEFVTDVPAPLSAAAHTFDLDADTDSTTGAPGGQEATVWAVTMELASVASEIELMSSRAILVLA